MHVQSLNVTQQIIVLACRSWLCGGETWAGAKRALIERLGGFRGRAAAGALDGFLGIFNAAAGRDIFLGRPCCRRLTPDEAHVLDLIGVCRYASNTEARRVLGANVPPTAARLAVDYGATLAGLFEEAGYALPPGVHLEPANQSIHVHPMPPGVH